MKFHDDTCRMWLIPLPNIVHGHRHPACAFLSASSTRCFQGFVHAVPRGSAYSAHVYGWIILHMHFQCVCVLHASILLRKIIETVYIYMSVGEYGFVSAGPSEARRGGWLPCSWRQVVEAAWQGYWEQSLNSLWEQYTGNHWVISPAPKYYYYLKCVWGGGVWALMAVPMWRSEANLWS